MEKSYWDKRWQNNETGWDIGRVSTPLQDYFDQLKNKDLKILIPGCGNAYEAEYLFDKGFRNVYLVELSELAIGSFRRRCPRFPEEQIIHGDFFVQRGQYDRMIEQTFFCAIEPAKRNAYAAQAAALLKPGGKLVGLLFNRHFEGGPPYGGTPDEYRQLFAPFFEIEVMETAYNSIAPRKDSELFIKLRKK